MAAEEGEKKKERKAKGIKVTSSSHGLGRPIGRALSFSTEETLM